MRVFTGIVFSVLIVALASNLLITFAGDDIKAAMYDYLCMQPDRPSKYCKPYDKDQKAIRLAMLNTNETKTWDEFKAKLIQTAAIIHYGRPNEDHLPSCARMDGRSVAVNDYNARKLCENMGFLLSVRDLVKECRNLDSIPADLPECAENKCKWKEGDFCSVYTAKFLFSDEFADCMGRCDDSKAGLVYCMSECCAAYQKVKGMYIMEQ